MTGRKLKGMVLKVKMVRGTLAAATVGFFSPKNGQRGDVPTSMCFPKSTRKICNFPISAGTRSIFFLCKGGCVVVFYDFFQGILEDGDGFLRFPEHRCSESSHIGRGESNFIHI